jgi:hypothetical protein
VLGVVFAKAGAVLDGTMVLFDRTAMVLDSTAIGLARTANGKLVPVAWSARR